MSLNIECQGNNEPTYVCFVLKIRVLTLLIRNKKEFTPAFQRSLKIYKILGENNSVIFCLHSALLHNGLVMT